MNISNIGTYLKAIINVEVEGYFIERFLNLCKINNIQIWNIKYINAGKISFEMPASKYLSIKKYIKKAKCKSNIIAKRGIYFDIFRYRKRKVAIYLSFLFFAIILILSTFIWKINIVGNENIRVNDIKAILKESNIKVGTNKLFISKSKIADILRATDYKIAWAGVEIKGTNLNIKIIEKIIEETSENKESGNVIASKSGIITKIIATEGVAKFKTGSYIEKGMIAIEGKIPSEIIDVKLVHANGILMANVEYDYQKEYKYKQTIKKKTKKKRYSAGLNINNKKVELKCLPKDYKYDITTKVKNFTLLGKEISIFFNTYEEYIEEDIKYTYDDLVKKARLDVAHYQKEMFDDLNLKIISKTENIINETEQIIFKIKYRVEENIGVFQKTGEN